MTVPLFCSILRMTKTTRLSKENISLYIYIYIYIYQFLLTNLRPWVAYFCVCLFVFPHVQWPFVSCIFKRKSALRDPAIFSGNAGTFHCLSRSACQHQNITDHQSEGLATHLSVTDWLSLIIIFIFIAPTSPWIVLLVTLEFSFLAAVASGLVSWGHFISSTIIDLIAQILFKLN